jgi:DNA-binding IclR family transcriptional regulator
VLRAFGAERRELTLSEVARTAGLSRAAARRFLLTLVQLGYAGSADGRFSLQPRVLELCHCFLAGILDPSNRQVVVSHLGQDGDDGGVRAVAVPIRDRAGTAVATLSLIARPGGVPAEALERACLPALYDAATAIERTLDPEAP